MVRTVPLSVVKKVLDDSEAYARRVRADVQGPLTEAVVASYGGGGGLIWRWRWPHTVVAVASYGGGGCLIWRWRWPHTAAMVASYSGGGLMWWWFVVFASLSLMHILHSLVVKIWVFYRGIWLLSVLAWWPLFFMYSSKILVQKVMCVSLCWCYVCCCPYSTAEKK